jgi:hypothetical protein
VKYSARPRKKIVRVRWVVTSLIHRITSECAYGVQRRPPTQRDDLTAISVEVSHGGDCAKVTRCFPIAGNACRSLRILWGRGKLLAKHGSRSGLGAIGPVLYKLYSTA